MNRHRVTLLLAILSTGLFISAAHAESPMCQVGSYGTSGGPVPLGVWFQALAAGGDQPLGFHWSFGDGETSTLRDPYHVYDEEGVYHAVLTVTPNGMPAQACRDTAVIPVGVVVDPLCWAAANETWAETADPIQFTAGPALLFDPPPYEWTWSFGDGTSTTLQTDAFVVVPHSYLTPGTYWAVVTLRTPLSTYVCYPNSLRVTALVPQVTAVIEPADAGLHLEPARPNPFGLMTLLGYELPRAGHVRLAIFDPQGRRIATLAEGERPAGRHVATWQGRAESGHLVPAGVYMAVLEQGGEARRVRIVRLP